MAHSSYIRGSLGAWGIASALTPAELWAFDQAQYKAINGDDGGTWAPSAAITIGGSGLALSGANHSVSGTLTVSSGGFLTVASGADLSVAGDLAVNAGGSMVVNTGATLDIFGAVDIESGSVVEWKSGSESEFESGSEAIWESGSNAKWESGSNARWYSGSNSTWESGSNLTIENGTVVTAVLGSASSVTVGCVVGLAGAGRITKRLDTNATDGSRTIAVTTADIFYNPSGVLSASCAWTLTNGANVGEEITLVNLDATYQITISGSILSVAGAIKNASGSFACASFVWNGTHWISTSATAV